MKVSVRGSGGTNDRDLSAGPVLITVADGSAAAVLGVAGDTPFIQPLENGPPLFLNDHRLAAAQWLRDGDQAKLASETVSVKIGAAGIALEAGVEMGFAPVPSGTSIAPPPPAPVPRRRRIRGRYVVVALAVLAVALWFVFSARMLYVEVTPAPDRVRLEGSVPALGLSDGYLALPGLYRLQAEREGYRPLVRDVEITRAANQRFVAALQKLPGYLSVDTPGVPAATVAADGAIMGSTPLADIELSAGQHEITVRAEGYADFSTGVRIEGLGRRQALAVALIRSSAQVTLRSNTAGATLEVDGKQLGPLPLTTELAAGTRVIRIVAPGHEPWEQKLTVVAGENQSIGPVTLAPANGEVRVESTPTGASVALDGRYAGTTPLTLALSPEREHRVTLSKRGYGTATRSIRVRAAQKRSLQVALAAETAPVTLRVKPEDATLSIEGHNIGRADGRHELPAAPTLLEIAREGYETAQLWVTPRPGFAQTLKVELRAAGAPAAATLPERITAPDGTVMILARPAAFTMGASRRDPGQRANETLHRVELARPYYLAATEVTNEQFRKFSRKHSSGRFGTASLENPTHPVVNVRWQEAAGYCNWLNEAAGLPPAYTVDGKELNAALPMQNGFRLPTEAEWAWAARHAGVDKPSRFPWGNSMPPTPRSGNFADASIAGELADAIREYNDGFTGTAPVGSFPPSSAGFFDLAGNAAEWVHDYYSIGAAARGRDPMGPATGKLHVIRGSSWMQGNISALRWTYRDYGIDPRPDVGFRCARYATETP